MWLNSYAYIICKDSKNLQIIKNFNWNWLQIPSQIGLYYWACKGKNWPWNSFYGSDGSAGSKWILTHCISATFCSYQCLLSVTPSKGKCSRLRDSHIESSENVFVLISREKFVKPVPDQKFIKFDTGRKTKIQDDYHVQKSLVS